MSKSKRKRQGSKPFFKQFEKPQAIVNPKKQVLNVQKRYT